MIFLLYVIFYVKFLRAYEDFSVYVWLIVSVVLMAAAGNLENDLFDVHTDRINRKANFYHHGNEKVNKFLPYIIYILALVSAAYFLTLKHKLFYIWYFVAVVILLFNYNHSVKKMPVIGNLIVSSLMMMLVLNIPMFYAMHYYDQLKLLFLALFVFPVNMNRELAKDFVDRKGDAMMRYETLVIISPRKALRLMFFHLVLWFVIFFLFIFNEHIGVYAKWYYAILVALPLLVHGFGFVLRPWYFRRYVRFYKWILFLGLTGIILM